MRGYVLNSAEVELARTVSSVNPLPGIRSEHFVASTLAYSFLRTGIREVCAYACFAKVSVNRRRGIKNT